MKILLDTHVFLWALLMPERLSKRTIKLLDSADSENYLSAASCWEITIKFAKGSLILPEPPKAFILNHLQTAGIRELPIRSRETLSVGDLPPIHKDPFDRLLIVQSKLNKIAILTDDQLIRQYDVETIAV